MRIILDGMGGDHAPDEIVKGAAEASLLIEHEICIVGDEPRMRAILETVEHNPDRISFRHTTEVITGEDSPVQSIRKKKDSSLVRGMEMVRDGEGDIFVSAGNSGALMSAGVFILGRIKGVSRPAIGSTYPILSKSTAALLIDSGANAECKATSLFQFALMGSLYAKDILKIENPRIGLVNMGTEPGKGSALLKEAYELLSTSGSKFGLNFVGNIEARDIPIGISDVIVCDGLVGNIVLKMTEGMALSISHLIRQKFTEGLIAKAGAALLYGKLGELKKAFDYTEYGGAPIFGLSGAVVKMHGSSDMKAVRNGIARAIPFMENRTVDRIAASIQELSALTMNKTNE
ncbi:MAG: phosphate acyltransferase PlsX [Clostridiales Family XIII bacterium]|jgi:glycerol-3-phosphate acyltransferase PlsX|nr:phosphate acyltransferase PlsX [Clostridiales Family XIII bacterium]